MRLLKNISESIHFIEIKIIIKKKADKIMNNFVYFEGHTINTFCDRIFLKEYCIFGHFENKTIFHTFFINISDLATFKYKILLIEGY